jgi:hypothetical protein
MDHARATMKTGLLLRWSLAVAAVLALGGCFERHEPNNPFIGPFGSSTSEPFAMAPTAVPGAEPVLAARQER